MKKKFLSKDYTGVRIKTIQTEEKPTPNSDQINISFGIIKQALVDIFDYVEDSELNKKHRRSSKKLCNDAIMWIMFDTEGTFVDCCDTLRISVEGVRNAMIKGIRDSNVRNYILSNLGIHKVC